MTICPVCETEHKTPIGRANELIGALRTTTLRKMNAKEVLELHRAIVDLLVKSWSEASQLDERHGLVRKVT